MLDPSGLDDLGGVDAGVEGFGDMATLAEATSSLAAYVGVGVGAKVELRAHPVAGVPFSDHLYVLFTDVTGKRTIYEGGPEFFHPPAGPWGSLTFGGKPWETDHHSDTDPSNVLLSGPAAADTQKCLDSASQGIQETHATYYPFTGPNSNSGARVLCQSCALNFDPPTIFDWGVDTPLTPGPGLGWGGWGPPGTLGNGIGL